MQLNTRRSFNLFSPFSSSSIHQRIQIALVWSLVDFSVISTRWVDSCLFFSAQLYSDNLRVQMSLQSSALQVPILVYYKFRGQLQPLRNFFCYLQIPFFQIHLERLESQKSELPEEVMSHFKKFKIDRSQLPTLIHQELMVEGHLPIMTYICRRFNRNDLLGQNIQVRAKLQEILEIYFLKQPQSMMQMFKVADYATQNHTLEQISEYRYRQLLVVLDSGYIKPICEYLHRQENPKYILGKLTLLDFFFVETCFYMLGSFDTNDESYKWERQVKRKFAVCQQKSANFYFHIMQDFLHSFKGEDFYVKYRDYLQSFKICSPMSSEERANGLHKTWFGDPKFIK